MSVLPVAPNAPTAPTAGRPLWPLIIYVVLLGFEVFIVATLISGAAGFDPRGCRDTQGYLPDYGPLLIGGVALVAGRVMGSIRFNPTWSDWQHQRRTQVIAGLSLFIILSGASLALIYEAIGTAVATPYDKGSLEPITYYVRCAIWHDKASNAGLAVMTSLVVAVSAFLVGHWLWARSVTHEPA